MSQQAASVVNPNRFTAEQFHQATDQWGFNCGPGALCAVLDRTPGELRPLLGEFERKGYTNPTLMLEILKRSGVSFKRVYRSDNPDAALPALEFGLVRVQWGGPWTKPGVPMRVRYRFSHWIAVRDAGKQVFDVNAIEAGGWINTNTWANRLVPWLCQAVVPKWDGTWWPTHAFEVIP